MSKVQERSFYMSKVQERAFYTSKVPERKFFMSKADQIKLGDKPRTHLTCFDAVGRMRPGKTKRDRALKAAKGLV